MASSEGTAARPATVRWPVAAQATLHCLTGCAIGEVLGMVIGTAARLPSLPTVILSIALAFVFGYGLTVRSVLRAGVGLRAAARAALAADTASIAVMELADNAVILAVPGAMDAGLGAARPGMGRGPGALPLSSPRRRSRACTGSRPGRGAPYPA